MRMKTDNFARRFVDAVVYGLAALLVAISFFAIIVGEGNKGLFDLF